MAYKYSTQITENCAKALGVGLPISTKQSIMVCQAIRGMSVEQARKKLEAAKELKAPIAFTRFTDGVGHKSGELAAGKFPVKTCTHILNILNSAEANAQFKGLSTGNLKIKHINAQRGPATMRSGRNRGQAKRTHIEIVLEEVKTR